MATCPKCNHVFKPKKGNKKYKKGAAYEYVVKRKLEEKGYTVTRSYASKGVFDLIAKKNNHILGIQVKSLSQKNKAYLTPKDRKELKNSWEVSKEPKFTRFYTQLVWDMKKHAAVELTFDYPDTIVHAYKDGMITKWMHLTDNGEWQPFKP